MGVDVGHLQNKDTSWSKMKFALLLCFLGLQTATAITPFEAIVEEWETWKLQYGKTYTRNYGDSMGGKYSQEESFRMKIWMENKAKIEKHNRHFYKGAHTFNLAMNEFGDLLHHEFVATLNGYRQVNKTVERPQGARYLMPAHTAQLPKNVDWREGSCDPRQEPGPVRILLVLLHHRGPGGDAPQSHWEARQSLRAEPHRLQQEIRKQRLQRGSDGLRLPVHQGQRGHRH